MFLFGEITMMLNDLDLMVTFPFELKLSLTHLESTIKCVKIVKVVQMHVYMLGFLFILIQSINQLHVCKK